MKKVIFSVFALVCLTLSAWGQATYTVTASPSTYASGGGQVLLGVTLSYPADSIPSLSAKPPASSWAFLGATGANIPSVLPKLTDTTEPAEANSTFGFSYITPPATSATFSFAVSYPAGMTGNQTINLSGHYRLGGALPVEVTMPPVTLTPTETAAAPVVLLQPASISLPAGVNAIFAVALSGVPTPALQWQRSTDGGSSWSNLSNDSTFSGVATSVLTVNAVSVGLNGHRFRVSATNTQSTVTSNGAATLTVTQAPVITVQPISQSVLAGSAATFTVSATGSGTLTYQWFFTPKNTTTPQSISGATSATYAIGNVQAANEGDYVCVVDNGVPPAATSNAAQLSVVARIVRIVGQTAAPGAQVVVPVELLASGAENTVSFSLNFDVTKITYVSSALGTGASGASMTRNVSQAASGSITFLVGMEPGTVFTAGTKTVLNITFLINASAADGAVLSLAFGDTPTARKIIDVNSAVLPGPFVDGTVTVSAGLEGDVNNDGQVDAADWVKLGRYVVGLDPQPTGATFRSADAAPRTDKGDGVVDAADWVQLGRFVVGLDIPQPAGGPTGPVQ